jgi:calcineurin-like phosphoesterase family protein
MKYFFTADEHYGHKNIIKYCDRPFTGVDEMNEEIIKRHNEVVGDDDLVYHLGDFTLSDDAEKYTRRLKGKHIFIRGSHDYWMDDTYHEILTIKPEAEPYVVLCHYAMKVWDKSHYNSWQLFGHSHGKLKGVGKQMDVGVDTHNFYPYSFEEIREIMKKKEDNFNLVLTRKEQ